jgi:uncharacterized membrane protein YdjX (TVP38/TMEM64 family)
MGSGVRPDDEGSAEAGAAPVDRLALAITIAALLGGAIAVLTIPELRQGFADAVRGDTGALRAELRSLGVGGVAILYALILLHTVVWYPTEIINLAAGFVYGFWGALALCLAGWVIQGIVAWAIGREVARPLLRRLIGARRYDEAERLFASGGVPLLLAIRLIPIFPFSLFSFIAGAARVRLWTFTWTTAVGYLPLTAIFVYLGSRLDDLSITDPLLLGGAVLLVALIALARPFRRWLAAR